MFRSPSKFDASTHNATNKVKINTAQGCNTCNVVVNELLAFVSHKVDTLTEPSILQICTSTYSFEEIEEARSIAMKLLAPTKKYMRRKEGSEQKCISDIIKLIKEFQPECLPDFVARNLNKLPAVSFDFVDVTVFLKEMTLLRQDVANLKNQSQADKSPDINLLRSEIEAVKSLLEKLRSSEVTRCKLQNKSVLKEETIGNICHPDYISAQVSLQPTTQKKDNDKHRVQNSVVNTTAEQTKRPDNRSLGVLTTDTPLPRYRDIVVSAPTLHAKCSRSLPTQEQKNDDDFILVERKKRKRLLNSTGTASSSSKLQVAETTSAIYVSRLNKNTTIEDIRDYISEMGMQCKNVEYLPQKIETDFNSYKVTVSKYNLENILSESFWPTGVKFRPYREYISRKEGRMPTKENK